ncbi:ABC transporter substrate-binding protein, partial [Moraxella catarrhalis]|uniref:ABC transporter substrate-binding protein n=1 Tax=Moraxella catarrhalis TaxID=480 RepID=UPI001953211E
KVAHFDRVEWRILPDPATAGAALQANEVDWAESVLSDIAPVLRRRRNLAVGYAEDATLAVMRFNHLHPPFDNPALRRAVLSFASQAEFMQGQTSERDLWKDGVGIFCPG